MRAFMYISDMSPKLKIYQESLVKFRQVENRREMRCKITGFSYTTRELRFSEFDLPMTAESSILITELGAYAGNSDTRVGAD